MMMFLTSAAFAQTEHQSSGRDAVQGETSLVKDLAELRAKVARLEAALERNHRGRPDHPDSGDTSSHQPGMGGMSKMGGDSMKAMGAGGGKGEMKMGDKPQMGSGDMGSGKAMPNPKSGGGMGMGKMGGMKMMGAMKMGSEEMSGGSGASDSRMAMNSALPGFPGASHLYHTGATGFFLDHTDHIDLTTEQVVSLNQIKEQSVLSQNTADRKIEQAEQDLWELTAAGEPDAKLIEEKIREIERLRSNQRFDFIRKVGEATKVLTPEQRQALLGFKPAGTTAETQPAPADPADHQNHQP
ncbi:MAG: hypothetical protein CMJ19_06185 [Phycisphaeraceae bacterium]|nr:hypothetical protein [Phycisphaeraceae bacterium]